MNVVTAATASGAGLRRFAAGLQRRHVLACTTSALLRWSLLLGIPLVLVAWLVPAFLPASLQVAAMVVVPVAALAAVRAWWRSRRLLSLLQQGLSEHESLHLVCDELATWLELDAGGRASSPAMLGWLERDVRARLQPLERQAMRAIARPHLGRWRWLLPVLLLLLLVWLLCELLAPPWSGAVGGFPNRSTAGTGDGRGGKGGGADSEPGDGQPEPDDTGQPAEQDPDRGSPGGQTPPPTQQQQPEQPAAADEPAPLLDLPDDRRFVLPEFIGDGPTRRARMHAAELEERAVIRAPDQQSRNVERDPDPDRPPPNETEFERAAERAQRARHVPAAERAIVRRFFDQLQQRARAGKQKEGR